MKIYRILFVLIFVSFNLTISAQRAGFEKDEIWIGDQIIFFLEIPEDIGDDIRFPELNDTLIDGIEIIEQFDISRNNKDNLLRKEYTITAFDDSLFLLYPFQFIVDGKIFKTNPVKLRVKYFQADSTINSEIDTTGQFPLADIKPTVNTPFTFNEFLNRFWMYIVIVVSVSIFFFLIRYFYRNRKKYLPEEKSIEIIIPAHEIAFRQLNELKDKDLHRADDLKPFYTELSLIIRQYLEKRFNIEAVESVTYEIIEEFQKTKFAQEETIDNLKNLLSLSDLVKFAKNKPNEQENLSVIERAYSFIEYTKELITENQENSEL